MNCIYNACCYTVEYMTIQEAMYNFIVDFIIKERTFCVCMHLHIITGSGATWIASHTYIHAIHAASLVVHSMHFPFLSDPEMNIMKCQIQ